MVMIHLSFCPRFIQCPRTFLKFFCSSTLESLEFQSMFLNVPEIDFHCKNTSIFSNFLTLHVHKPTTKHNPCGAQFKTLKARELKKITVESLDFVVNFTSP